MLTKGDHVSCIRAHWLLFAWVSLDLPMLHILWHDERGSSFC